MVLLKLLWSFKLFEQQGLLEEVSTLSTLLQEAIILKDEAKFLRPSSVLLIMALGGLIIFYNFKF